MDAPTASAKLEKYRKQKIPAAIREAVWVKRCGRVFEHKCYTSWCQNTITAFDFQCGHNIPESKGGTLVISNLYPLCARCNVSMGDRYTIDEWNAIEPVVTAAPQTWRQRMWARLFGCFNPVERQSAPPPQASPSRRANP